jgi:tyrosinase
MGIRKNYRSLTEAEREGFVHALHHVKADGLVDQFAEMHKRHFFHGIHVSSHFLPWHREMLLRFERGLQENHPDVTIPYWDSSVDSNTSDPLFWSSNFLGQFNSAWNLSRALGSDTLPTPQQVETNQKRGTYDTFWPELENPIHNSPHRWVEGVMATAASPGDPIFYLHHCWIDMLWAKWQLANPSAPFVPSRPDLGLNDPLMEWPDRTPADVLDHHALGYSYDSEQPRQEGVGKSIAVGYYPDGALELFLIGTDDAIYCSRQNGLRGSWSSWEPI